MSVSQLGLLSYLNQLLTPELFEDYAPNGLQIEGKSELKRLAFAVSATQDSLTKALAWGADGLTVHHGVFWKHHGAKPVIGPWGERLKLAIRHELNLFAYHLPLDAHPEVGNAAALARALGMSQLQPFAVTKRQPLGIKGKLSAPVSARALREEIQHLLAHPVILASRDEGREIQTVGIITGGANNEWVRAQEDGLDAYLTGEISEYNWHDAREAGIHYFAGGHHATERPGIICLMQKVKSAFPDLEVTFIDSENPA